MNPTVIETQAFPGERSQLHLYRPNTPAPVPFVFFIHGGGWQRGDQTSLAWAWKELEPLGVGLVLPSYRLAPEHPFPCAFEDLCQLLAWVKDHGASLGLDPSRMLLMGGSAGSHLAMLLATRALKEGRPMPTVKGVATYCGIMDLAAQYEFDRTRGATMTESFLKAAPAEAPEQYRLASPIAHVHAGIPPVWMAHGTVDDVVPVEQSRAMVAKMREAGVSVHYQEAEGRSHTMVEEKRSEEEPPRFLFRDSLFAFVCRQLA
mgnify:CR=1 FL=1